ncbi:hypothetical protein [Nocardia terpenica]|uniref:Uncharacterized protein n=1 Tax=Nocardia terpenica TaxID=455432 RepID=A0A164PF67_9NOCA|nr:hypothetical protein [Nocardia terpenica]KZM75487.1 hypothetical protein AWN90_19090 [Nocardia terpenica]NQE85957.1 hypothetical protein [Nocardia terpenica]
MDRSDEALMREAFAQYWHKHERVEQLYREAEDLASAWLDGPLAEHWQYLGTAVADWVAKPNMMRRYTTLLANGRTMPDVTTDIQARSIYQAQLLADPNGHQVVAPEDQQLAVELVQARTRLDVAASYLIDVAHPNGTSRPDPVRVDTARALPPAAVSGSAGNDLDL